MPVVIISSGMKEDIVDLASKLAILAGYKVLRLSKPYSAGKLRNMLKRAVSAGCLPEGQKPEHCPVMSAPDYESAFTGGLFVPYFQPQICLHTEQVSGVEVLARLQRVDGRTIGPSAFVHHIESDAYGVEFALYMLEKALPVVRFLERTYRWRGKLSINIPQAALENRSFARELTDRLVLFDFPPSRLICELTERRSALALRQALGNTGNLLMRGIEFSIDDFGTGHSSIERLTSGVFNELKVDRSFVRDLVGSPIGSEITRAIVRACSDHEIRTVAEGVENPAMLAAVIDAGFTHVQGYAICPPVPGGKLIAWMDRKNKATRKL